jgi:hypothetical protein
MKILLLINDFLFKKVILIDAVNIFCFSVPLSPHFLTHNQLV